MPKHLYLIVISTFVMGFLTGMYVYFASRVPTEPDPLPDRSAEIFEVSADMYGGCESVGCRSYRIVEDGSYTFIQGAREGEDRRFDDVLSEKLVADILDLAEETDFEDIEGSTVSGTCPILFDGNAYTFSILFEGIEYSIDTCKNNVEGVEFFDELTNYFEIFYITHVR